MVRKVSFVLPTRESDANRVLCNAFPMNPELNVALFIIEAPSLLVNDSVLGYFIYANE